MSTKIHFYDSSQPRNIPSGVYAAAYANGFVWPDSDVDRMSHIFRISVLRASWWAKYARCIDVENGAALPEDVVPFIHERIIHTHGDNDSITYVNRANWDAVKRLVEVAGLTTHYWVATLDGTQDVPGAWAVQYQGGDSVPYDLSVLHGVDDFARVTS